MKRLMLDYFRRWWWVLGLAALPELVIGWLTAGNTDNNPFGPASVFQLQITLFSGAFLLSFDLQRGIARTVVALPLTARQIGRTWWLMTVGIPAFALASWLGLGAGLYHLLHPAVAFPVGRLALASLFTLVCLGSMFTLISNATRGQHGNGWERGLHHFFGVLVGLMIGSVFLFFQAISESPVKTSIFLGLGAVLTVAGWIRAEQFVVGRATSRLAGRQANDPRGQHRAPDGYGGIPFLIGFTFVRALFIGVAMVLMMPLFMAFQGHMRSWREAINTMGGVGNYFPFYFIIIFQTIPTLTQLRFLRTLPMPASCLAAVMLALVILPLVGLGALVAGVARLSVDASASLAVLRSFTLTLAPASVCIVFFVWWGVGVQAFAALVLTMSAFQFAPLMLQGCFQNQVVPFSLMGGIAGGCVLLSFLLTRQLLTHSSRPYRVQAGVFGGPAWGAGR